MVQRKQHRACFSNSARAIVLTEVDMSTTAKQQAKKAADMNMYQPTPADLPVPSKHPSAAQRACEEIRRHTGILERHLRDVELQEAENKRLEDLNERYTELALTNNELTQWLNMIKEALVHHDNGELNARQFANEIDAAIKGWEGK